MKSTYAVMLPVFIICMACASRPASQTTIPSPSIAIPSSTQTAKVPVSDKIPCSMGVDQSPVLSGLRLGMTSEQVLTVFPGSKDDPEVRARLARPPSSVGESELAIRPGKYEPQERFAGINQITFVLLDGRVSSLNVSYNGPEYSHVDKFVAKFVEGTTLPPADAWEPYVGLDTQMKTLNCNDFELRIFAGGKGGTLNYVLLTDLVAAKKVKEREDKAAEKATP